MAPQLGHCSWCQSASASPSGTPRGGGCPNAAPQGPERRAAGRALGNDRPACPPKRPEREGSRAH
eukprot:11203575-Lingulodinium_polyedra.AAC.1